MLVRSPATATAIKALSHRAHSQPYTHPHIRRLFFTPRPDRTLVIPHGHTVEFTVAQFRPGWLARQLAIIGPELWPDVEDVRYLMKSFDFKHPLEKCVTWPAGNGKRRQVNILEPLNGDWGPFNG
jgi:hypothetical protein